MKKYILFLAALSLTYMSSYAGSGVKNSNETNTNTTTKQWLFKPLAANEVSLEVERLGGEVMIYLFSQNMSNVESIQIERSKTPNGGYTLCKTIAVQQFLLKSKNYIGVTDDSPYSSGVDSYYRIKVQYMSGASKTLSWVNLSPIMPIENETVEK